MKIVLPGGSGQVGTVLARAFAGDGHEVVILSRGGAAAAGRAVLKSRRVAPGRLLDAGFAFRHPNWPEAARSLCAAWRLAR